MSVAFKREPNKSMQPTVDFPTAVDMDFPHFSGYASLTSMEVNDAGVDQFPRQDGVGGIRQ